VGVDEVGVSVFERLKKEKTELSHAPRELGLLLVGVDGSLVSSSGANWK